MAKSQLGKRTSGKIPVIVSLTTIPSRLKTLPITIKSLLDQDCTPEKIVLWVNSDLRGQLPRRLTKLEGGVFEIRYSPYTFSHRKLIHSLEEFPEKVIITCDDDLIYHPSALRLTYAQHEQHPDKVIGNRCREITYDDKADVLPYLQWPFVKTARKNKKLLMPVGAFMVLYPPRILDTRVADVALFIELAPKSDDLWFKACTLLNHKLSVVSQDPPPEPLPIMGTQKFALKHENTKGDRNRKQWEDLVAHFNFSFGTTTGDRAVEN